MDNVKTSLDSLMEEVNNTNKISDQWMSLLNQQLCNEETCTQVVASPWIAALVHFLIHSVMNQPAELVSARTKTVAVSCLVNLSRVPDEEFRERLLMAHILRLGPEMDNLLKEKEAAHREYGVALGRQHEQFIILLMRCSHYTLSASDILNQFCEGNATFALDLLTNVMKIQSSEMELRSACVHALYELSLPQTYFQQQHDAPSQRRKSASSFGEIQLADFESKVDKMIELAMHSNMNAVICAEFENLSSSKKNVTKWSKQNAGSGAEKTPGELAMLERLRHLQWANLMKDFTTMFLNLLRFTTNSTLARTWRQSVLITEKEIFTAVILPHIIETSGWIAERLRSTSPSSSSAGGAASNKEDCSVLVHSFSACFRFLCVASFEFTVDAALKAKLHETTNVILNLPPQFLRAHLPLLAHILQCHVNMDTLVEPVIITSVEGESEADKNARYMLLHELKTLFAVLNNRSGGGGGGGGINGGDAETLTHLQRLCSLVSNTTESKFVSLEKGSFAALTNLAQQTMDHQHQQEHHTTRAMDGACDVTMHGAIEGGEDLTDEELDIMAAQLDDEILQLEHAIDEMHDTRDALAEVSPIKQRRQPAEGEAEQQRLLGDLPPLPAGGGSPAQSHHEKKKTSSHLSKVAAASVAGKCPTEFLCGLTKKIMSHPVRLPNGNVYEQSALERIVAEVGHVDPITGEALEFDEVNDVDHVLRRRILEFSLQQCAVSGGDVLF